MRKVLAVGAHYDDIEIGVGGTLLKHINKGDEVFVAISESDEYRTGDPYFRYKEQLHSLEMLGIDENKLILFKADDNIYDVVGELDKINTDIVYVMFDMDTHPAHRRCSYIGQSVGRKLSTQVIFYNSGTSYDFLPNIFSIISFEFKQNLLMCFKSQIELKAINVDIITKRESYWASLITDELNTYAEGFMIRKMLYDV